MTMDNIRTKDSQEITVGDNYSAIKWLRVIVGMAAA